ncbi:unnamed protein product [Blepharisma stoltei]|uniref:Uncharacterized protein n=1 Tax=Blepharisma stoltei TaxID=1481888 RepID=A0AAU9JGX3_9CILI|nr:unnamed protein product [Blepharisma stoltei]
MSGLNNSYLKLSDELFENDTPISTKSSKRRNCSATPKEHHRTISETKGIEMYLLSQERKQADENLKLLKNRIKHLETEQQKANKAIEAAKMLSSKRQTIREKHELFKKGIETALKEREIETVNKKRDISTERQRRKESIERSKKNLIEKNSKARDEAIAQKIQNENFLKQRFEAEKNLVTERARKIFNETSKASKSRTASSEGIKQVLDEMYRSKMNETRSKSRIARRQAEELTRIEALMEENLKKTVLLQNTYYQFLFESEVSEASFLSNKSRSQTPRNCTSSSGFESEIPNMKYLDKIIAEISSDQSDM